MNYVIGYIFFSFWQKLLIKLLYPLPNSIQVYLKFLSFNLNSFIRESKAQCSKLFVRKAAHQPDYTVANNIVECIVLL